MLTARPTYSAMTPRLNRITPVATMSRIIAEDQGKCHHGREQHCRGAEGADPAQGSGAAGEHQAPEVTDQAAEGVAGGAVALAAHLDRAGGGAVGDPGDGDVEVDAGAGIGRDRAGDLAEHQPEAGEGAGV